MMDGKGGQNGPISGSASPNGPQIPQQTPTGASSFALKAQQYSQGSKSVFDRLQETFKATPPETIKLAARIYQTYDAAYDWLCNIEKSNKRAPPPKIDLGAKRDVHKPTMSIREKFSRPAPGGQLQQDPSSQPGPPGHPGHPGQYMPHQMYPQQFQNMNGMQYNGQFMPPNGMPMPPAHMQGMMMHQQGQPHFMPQQMMMNNNFQAAPHYSIRNKNSMGFAGPNAMSAAPVNKRKLARQLDEEEDGFSDDSEEEEQYNEVEEAEFNERVLNFFNTASLEDIIDVAAATEEMGQVVVDARPFKTLDQIAKADITQPEAKKKSSRGKQRKSVGEKVMDACLTTLRGYEAVDSLVQECERLGSEVAKGIKAWGVDTKGANAELEITEVGDADSSYFKEKPALLAEDVELKNYQQVGINWLNLLYEKGLSCILADEMGLGKTCQVIAFLAHLKETEARGPHLIVVPSSTLENWLREFRRFCPSLSVECYYGSLEERAEIREQVMRNNGEMSCDVVVTTYNMACGAKNDHAFLKNRKFNVCVYDEGHMLKNSLTDRYAKLMKLKADFRLLLTGTPLQNNLTELVSLLSFILPSLFTERRDDLAGIFKHKVSTSDAAKSDGKRKIPLLSEQRIAKAKTMMTPFVLRRRKDQVLQHLPEKSHVIEYCDMSDSQKAIYTELEDKRAAIARAKLENRKDEEKSAKTKEQEKEMGNILMQLRKAAMHPLLFRRIYDDKKIRKMTKEIMKEECYQEANEDYIFEDMQYMSDFELNRLCEKFSNTIGHHRLTEDKWMDSGKVKKLAAVLKEMKADGNRVLIFSQFTQMLDILERVLNSIDVSFLRLDGQTPVEVRQDMIDKFHEETDITAFLLSTKAGGFGINLACANRVVIFDLSFNPQDDKQAEDRAHRVGQTREVSVMRLITKQTIEESILALANTKLELDKSISEDDAKKAEEANELVMTKMLFGEDKAQAEAEAAEEMKPKEEKDEGDKEREDNDQENEVGDDDITNGKVKAEEEQVVDEPPRKRVRATRSRA